MDYSQMLIFFLAAFFVSWVSAIAGFGGGLLMILAASYFYDLKTTIALCILYFGINNLQKYWHNKTHADHAFIKLVLAIGVPACAVGLWGFYYIEVVFLKYFMAALCFYLVATHCWSFMPQFRSMNRGRLLTLGGLWGFFTGLANAMPIKVMMLRARGLKKQAFVATGAAISLAVDCVKLPGYALMGLYQKEHLFIFIPMLLASILGNIIGKKCLDQISAEAFEKLVMLMLFLGGIQFLFK